MLSDKYITKIEGHGSLEIDWQKNKVELRIHEGERLFEGILVGRTVEEAHWITPRICGVCPIAHNLASLKAIENGMRIEISETASLFRDLMVSAQMLQSHILHLFFLSLPDYLGIDRGTELAHKNPKVFKMAMDIKEIGDEIATVVSGRSVHPVTTTIGGFHKYPRKKELMELLKKIEKAEKSAEGILKLCLSLEFPELKSDFELVAQKEGEILGSKGEKHPVADYKNTIEEEIRNNSTAKFGTYKNREMFVGSLARLYFNLKDEKMRANIDFQNPFHNNLAQAIEIVEYQKKAEEIIKKLLENDLTTLSVVTTSDVVHGEFKGIGALEAPRGGLYHEFAFSQTSSEQVPIITYANIITPTVQNLTSIEKSAQMLLEQCLPRAKSRETIKHLLDMLVRAYDPCITCSVH
ncbi:MAG: nickel-dependent hydrogenase large subunit [bacterium]|nr:nickel-dependent hydrogenase large subunit [bacterium]